MGEAKESNDDMVIASIHSTVFKESENLDGKCQQIEGYDFNRGVAYRQLLSSMISPGFQASNLGDAIQVVNQMLDWRLADEPITEDCTEEEKDLDYRKSVTCFWVSLLISSLLVLKILFGTFVNITWSVKVSSKKLPS